MISLLRHLVVLLILITGCTTNLATNIASPTPVVRGALFEYPYFQDQVTGIAVSPNGRIFVNFPRWQKPPRYSVAEVLADGSYRPFPDEQWNKWGAAEANHPESHFICVQSVVVDDAGFLWVVDAASPAFKGVVPGGAKLVKFNLKDGTTEQVVPFNADIAPQGSYLNDMRVNTRSNFAYVTDSGSGAIIVVNLTSGKMRRILATHSSTKAEEGYVPIIDGRELRDESSKVPRIHADGVALDHSNGYLYYHALTAKTLYRLRTVYLENFSFTDAELAGHVEKVAETGAVDGMACDKEGNVLFTALEDNAIKKWQPSGRITTIVTDAAIHWPDSISISSDQYLYFTDSKINLSPRFNHGDDKHGGPYGFFKIWLAPFQVK